MDEKSKREILVFIECFSKANRMSLASFLAFVTLVLRKCAAADRYIYLDLSSEVLSVLPPTRRYVLMD